MFVSGIKKSNLDRELDRLQTYSTPKLIAFLLAAVLWLDSCVWHVDSTICSHIVRRHCWSTFNLLLSDCASVFGQKTLHGRKQMAKAVMTAVLRSCASRRTFYSFRTQRDYLSIDYRHLVPPPRPGLWWTLPSSWLISGRTIDHRWGEARRGEARPAGVSTDSAVRSVCQRGRRAVGRCPRPNQSLSRSSGRRAWRPAGRRACR